MLSINPVALRVSIGLEIVEEELMLIELLKFWLLLLSLGIAVCYYCC